MELVAVIAILLLGCLVAVVALYANELRRIARFIEGRPDDSNVPLPLGFPLPGLAQLVEVVDDRLARERQAEQRRRVAEQEFQEGLTGLSHDIRTPLAGAMGYLQLAADEPDPGARGECLAAAQLRLAAMRDLLDQLFAYTRSDVRSSERDGVESDSVAVLEEVLLGSLSRFEEAGAEPGVELGDGPLVVPADRESLRRMFDNVVDNMLKHGKPPYRICRRGDSITFANGVEDASALDVERVFDRFYRSDEARSKPGAGLGLATVRNLCEGAGMQAEASLGENGCFVVTIKASQK